MAEEEQRASFLALRALQALAGAKSKEDAEKLRAAIAAAAPHAVVLPALAAELAAGQRTLDRLDCDAPPAAYCCPITQAHTLLTNVLTTVAAPPCRSPSVRPR